MEICYKLLEKDRVKHLRDPRLYDHYVTLSSLYHVDGFGEGDFSERLQAFSQSVIHSFKDRNASEGKGLRLNAAEVTGLIYKHNIRSIRETLVRYLKLKDSVWVLFDNLDKGWSSHGITKEDIVILRCLIDSARKIQRQFQQSEIDFHCVVFVRNDVYQLLVENSADYGKENRAVMDWTDPDLLREVLRRRLVHDSLPKDTPFDPVWVKICVSHYKGEESSQDLIDRTLMRPRNLIKLLSHCRSFAVGLERLRIEETDLEKGLRAYSLDLITEADQELRDIVGQGSNLIYHFIGEGDEFDEARLSRIILGGGVPLDKLESVVEYLLYYGFVGVKIPGVGIKYIFDVGYDMKLFKSSGC